MQSSPSDIWWREPLTLVRKAPLKSYPKALIKDKMPSFGVQYLIRICGSAAADKKRAQATSGN